MNTKWALGDTAYACFGLCGVIVLALSASDFFGWNLALIGWVALIIFFAALILSVISWRHLPLLFLSLISLAFAAIAVSNSVSETFSDVSGWLYGIMATCIPSWWFIIGRRRKLGKKGFGS